MSVRALSLALACLYPAAHAAENCAVPGSLPVAFLVASAAEGKSASAGEAAIEEAQRLIAAGKPAEARARLVAPGGALDALPRERRALATSLVALAAAAEGELEGAGVAVRRTRELAAGLPPSASLAAAHLNAGWALTEIGDVPETRIAFEAAATTAERAGDRMTAATARVHRALLEGRIGADIAPATGAAREALRRIDDPAARARLGVALGLALVPETRTRSEARVRLAGEVLNAAYADASGARAARELTHALGLLGELQLVQGDAKGAAATLDRAVAASRALADDPWRFRWSWKAGVAHRAAGNAARAATLLQAAVDELEAAKAQRSLGRFSGSSLARDYRRAYLDLADALLANPAGAATQSQSAALKQVRATMELARSAEIEDFFNDPCVASRSQRVAEPEALDARAAIIHPLLFEDRLELLVSHKTGIARFVVPQRALAVTREVQRLRNAVERPGSLRYLQPAAKLHDWLVAPIAGHLAKLGVATLVWVPDGALRGLPFAALHDGRTHLVERFAVAVTPMATLTDPRPFAAGNLKAALTGLTIASQGFAALPGVGEELDALSALLGVRAIRDAAFTEAALRDTLRRSPVNTLHIASHGQFAPEAGQTFLVTSDGHVTLPELRSALAAGKTREEPLELIVLSACQTAAGDDRAALGLAGVAIGAGARSAVATLWAVSDDSTARLTEGFYRGLLSGKSSRAASLRDAQLVLLADPATAHPFYWAPYLLIGNWM